MTSVVYLHKRLDTNEVFYIGVGINKYRASSKFGRSNHWYNVVNKHGYKVEIYSKLNSYEEALNLEKKLIKEYGRLCNKTGKLINITEGGDGIVGMKHSEESKLKMSLSNKGVSLKARQNALKSNSKKVIDVSNGKVYNSIKEAAKDSSYSILLYYDF